LVDIGDYKGFYLLTLLYLSHSYLSCEITQRYLPPNTSERAPP